MPGIVLAIPKDTYIEERALIAIGEIHALIIAWQTQTVSAHAEFVVVIFHSLHDVSDSSAS